MKSSRGGPDALPLRMGYGCFLHQGRCGCRADVSPSWSRISEGDGHGPRAVKHILPHEGSGFVFEQLQELICEVDDTPSLPEGQTSPPRNLLFHLSHRIPILQGCCLERGTSGCFISQQGGWAGLSA